MTTQPRLPDFIIIGTMKSGTTSLYQWFADLPELWLPSKKEPDFFSSDVLWTKGVAWYADLFSAAPPEARVGEASTSYTSPGRSERSAERMAAVVPDVRLIAVVRHPIERMRSHYRHQVQRGRERRPLVEALAEPDNTYVGHSLYHACLRPYIERFSREQLCVIRFEDLVGGGRGGGGSGDELGWSTVLGHLGVAHHPQPATSHNVTAEKPQFRGPMLWLWETGLTNSNPLTRLPAPVRRLGKRLLTRQGPAYDRQLQASLMPIPPAITEPVWDDARQLAPWLGVDKLWPTPTPNHQA